MRHHAYGYAALITVCLGITPVALAETPDKTQLSGFRMGFRQARGSVSSLTSSFSGNIGLKLTGSAGTERDATLFNAASGYEYAG